MKRWVGVGAVLALLVAALGYVSGPTWGRPAPGAEGTGTRREGDATARPLPVSALLGAPLPSARGNLFIRGTVLGLDGRPVAGAVVVATAPTPGETLSELPCPCDGGPPTKLPRCACATSLRLLVEHGVERRGEASPHARTTSDAQGRFSLEGLEAGTYAVWAEGAFGTVLRKDVPAGSEGLELRAGPGITLSGRVRDEDGNPAAGALVTALLVEPSRFFDTLADAEGNWRLGPLPWETYQLIVTWPGFLPEHEKVDEERASGPLETTLYRPLRLSGQVLREGHPVAGARVHAAGGNHEQDTSTDAQGHFTLEGLRQGSCAVSASHAGLDAGRNVWLQPGAEPQDVLLELGTDTRVTGTVRDPGGHPIAGATVRVKLGVDLVEDPTKNTRTAEDGTYTLGPIPLGSHRLTAVAPRYYSAWATLHALEEGPYSQDFTLQPNPLVQGRVVNAAGQPLPGVRLELKEQGTGEANDAWSDTTTSAEDGTFVLDALQPIDHRLRARLEDFLPTDQTVRAPASGVQVVLRAGAGVEGEVVDEQERPVLQARVVLKLADPHGAEESAWSRETRTDERGHFRMQGLEPGGYVVSAGSETGEELRTGGPQPVESRGTEPARVRLQLQRFAGLTLSGIVVDEAGNPVSGATLALQPEEQTTPEQVGYFQMRRGEPRTGADGRFQVHHLMAGRYWLRASAEGYRFEQAPDQPRYPVRVKSHPPGVEARAGATDVRIVLEKAARLRGRAVRPDGTPVTRFKIGQWLEVDPRGAFSQPIFASGEQTLVFTAPNLAETTRTVVLKEGVDTELGEVVLTPGRDVRGRVVEAATGAPVAGAKVSVGIGLGEMVRLPGIWRDEVRTARDGTFTLTHLKESPLTLGVDHPDYPQARMMLTARQTEVTVELDAGATLRGEVHLARPGPFEVDVFSPYGTGKKAHVVGNHYEARGLPADTYALLVRTTRPGEASNLAVPPRPVVIPARGVVVLDIQETPARATLRVRLAGPPVPQAVFFLVMGSVPLPDSEQALLRLPWLHVVPRGADANVFQGVPAGHYTLLVRALMEDGPQWYREELELPGEGEVSRDISPRWVGIPDPR
ncbi:carboxypeptidase regulatory-like domain-containing protein [Archangium sp.]|uniref:carboxypeptidase regulatory-like domain-containing protein n=1 Tax=Archangium sp. TaxID=1872627 RepID=UPI00389A8877